MNKKQRLAMKLAQMQVAGAMGAGSSGSTLLNGLTLGWNFDETSNGTAQVDRSDVLGVHTLTDVNTTASATGKINNGADFEQNNSEDMTHADHADFRLGDGVSFSWAGWVKAETLNSTVLNKGGTTEYLLYMTSGGSPRFRFDGKNKDGGAIGHTFSSATGNLSTATWYCFILSFNAATGIMRLRVNGGTAEEWDSSTTGINSSTGTFYLSSNNGASVFFDGIKDEFYFYKGRVLTSDEEDEFYNSGNAKAWSFED